MPTPSRSVKDLATIFERPSSTLRRPSADHSVPTPTPARFLRHPLLKTRQRAEDDEDIPLKHTSEEAAPSSTPPTLPPAYESGLTRSVLPTPAPPNSLVRGTINDSNDERQNTNDQHESNNEQLTTHHDKKVSATSIDQVAPESPTITATSTLASYRPHLRPPPIGSMAKRRDSLPLSEYIPFTASTRTDEEWSAPSSLFPRQSRHHNHVHHFHSPQTHPVPATTLFSRKAQPLSLPELDRYLENIPAPNFTAAQPVNLKDSMMEMGEGLEDELEGDGDIQDIKPTKGQKRKKIKKPLKSNGLGLFPPMEFLIGKTIADLKNNSAEPPLWRDRNSIFQSLSNWVIGATGSSALASFYSLQGIYDTVQVFALILGSVVPIGGGDIGNQWRKLFLGTIPNVLALNFAPVLTQSMIFLVLFQLLAFGLMWYFHRATARFVTVLPMQEGLLGKEASSRNKGWGVLVVSFVLLILYLPISTIAVHALVWSDDFWVVTNPYINATTFPPDVPPLGPSNEYREPLDFCWTTTMKQESFNYAPIMVVLSIFTFASMTIYFPIRLWRATKQALPHVDRYSDLGRLRSQTELEHEYQRVLARDKNPLAFLYNEYCRMWGTYKSVYLLAKLCTLFTIAVIDPNNCLFRNYNRSKVEIIRQGVLTCSMFAALMIQCFLAPYIDPVSNASEWTSRASYFVTSGIGLLVALDVKGKSALNGPVLYVVYFLTYGLNFYFTIVNFSWVRRIVKRLARRIDFSIDIFSPHLDTSRTSVHTKRRIYQETISTLLLATPECHMPHSQRMIYKEAQDSEWPPYLLEFGGSPAERHAENLKILREVGSVAYMKGIDMWYGACGQRFREVQESIESHFLGPDSFWRPKDGLPGCSHYFGNAWWIPFPPTVVIKYDSGPSAVLTTMAELEEYLAQNSSAEVIKKRDLRLALRALDGQVVCWPYVHTELVGAQSRWPPGGRKYEMQSSTSYESCMFTLKRKGDAMWQSTQLGSGFDVELRYSRSVVLGPAIIGLDDDFDLTPQLSRFLLANRLLINRRITEISRSVRDYRLHLKTEARRRRQVLSYRFLSAIYDHPASPLEITETLQDLEQDFRVRRLPTEYESAFIAAHERMRAVSRSEVTVWWFIFWDDLWRRNYETSSALRLHEPDFNPRYPTSIAYRPVPRAVLEAFLTQRGLLSTPKPKFWDFVHPGFLNKIYLRLNQIAFQGSSKIVHAHVGDESTDLDLTEMDLGSYGVPSRIGTGGGTDQDDNEIRARPTYRWEDVFNESAHKGRRIKRWRPWKRFGVWFGLTPLSTTTFSRTNGVTFDVKLVQGRYVVMDDDDACEWAWMY